MLLNPIESDYYMDVYIIPENNAASVSLSLLLVGQGTALSTKEWYWSPKILLSAQSLALFQRYKRQLVRNECSHSITPCACTEVG
jgi:hypothetical protein